MRALFEIAKEKNYAFQVSRTLMLAQMFEQQCWDDSHPLEQFKELQNHLNNHRAIPLLNRPIEDIREMSDRELESIFRTRSVAQKLNILLKYFR